MAALTKVFGNTPRVRLLEALVRLAPVEFTRAELTTEANGQGKKALTLHKPSATRALDRLAADGYVICTSSKRPARFRVNEDNPYFRVVGVVNAFSDNLQDLEASPTLLEEEFQRASGFVTELSEQHRTVTLAARARVINLSMNGIRSDASVTDKGTTDGHAAA